MKNSLTSFSQWNHQFVNFFSRFTWTAGHCSLSRKYSILQEERYYWFRQKYANCISGWSSRCQTEQRMLWSSNRMEVFRKFDGCRSIVLVRRRKFRVNGCTVFAKCAKLVFFEILHFAYFSKDFLYIKMDEVQIIAFRAKNLLKPNQSQLFNLFIRFSIPELVQITSVKRMASGLVSLGFQSWNTPAKALKIFWNNIGQLMAETISRVTTMKNALWNHATKWWPLLRRPSPIQHSLARNTHRAVKLTKPKSLTTLATPIQLTNPFPRNK